MKFRFWIPLAALVFGACGSSESGNNISGPPLPLLLADGSASVAGTPVALAYGAAKTLTSGTVNVELTDQEFNCSSFAMTNPPDHGTFIAVQVSSATLGPASKNFVDFSVFANGDYAPVGGGSNAGTVEVMAVSDTAITVRVAYKDTIKNAELVLNGDFGVTRCAE